MIGEAANPPFAVAPIPRSVFERRRARFIELAPTHSLGAYLEFLSRLSAAQLASHDDVPAMVLPYDHQIATAREHQMPPLSLAQIEFDERADRMLLTLVDHLERGGVNEPTAEAIGRLRAMSPVSRRDMMLGVLLEEMPAENVAEHVLAFAAAQVLMVGLAAQLNADALVRVADAACPACGGAPVSSMVVGWAGAHGTRFCTCSVCATQWHVPRIRCLPCGDEKGVAYHSIEGGDGTVMGETCEACGAYVKMLHHFKNGALDPVADDVASLALDLTLTKDGWRRHSVNPFLAGY